MKKLLRLALLAGLVSVAVGSAAAKEFPPPPPLQTCDEVRTHSCAPHSTTTCIDSMGVVGSCYCAPTGVWICPD